MVTFNANYRYLSLLSCQSKQYWPTLQHQAPFNIIRVMHCRLQTESPFEVHCRKCFHVQLVKFLLLELGDEEIKKKTDNTGVMPMETWEII